MSSEKTTNLQLNKWVSTDYVKMDEFNENFDKIDAKIGEHTETLSEYATEITTKTDKEIFASSIQISNGMINRMIEVGQTYLNNIDKLVYGNFHTAYNSDCSPQNGKWEIDCSSFTNLLINGVTFENSRYNGNAENITDRLFFHGMDPYTCRYSHEIAKWCYDNGYTFYPKPDMSNLQAGDIVFYSWNNYDIEHGYTQAQIDNHNKSFMKIDHVGIYLQKKNENIHTLLQLDNGFTTVYYDATPEYMSQCVLVARLPFPNADTLFPDNNILLKGDVIKNVSNATFISDYKLSKQLVKGRYYTFFIEGNVLTPDCYFVLQVGTQTVFSDYGRVLPYSGVAAFRFPYLLETTTDTISLKIGMKNETDPNRSATVKWCALYEGYVRNKKYYNLPNSAALLKDFALDPALIFDLNASMGPYYKYAVDVNKIFINFSLPFNTLRTGSLTLGTLDITLKNTQRIPINLIGNNNQAINAILQITSSGVVSIIPFDSTTQWRYALANGCVFTS